LLVHDPKLAEAFNQITQGEGEREKEKATIIPKLKTQQIWDEDDFDPSPDVFGNSIPAPQPSAPEATPQEVVTLAQSQPQPPEEAQGLDDISYQILIEMIVPMVEALPPVEVDQVKENETAREIDSFLESPAPSPQNLKEEPNVVSQVLPQQEQKTGIQAVSEALSELSESPTKTVLSSTVAEMGATLPVQQPNQALENLGLKGRVNLKILIGGKNWATKLK
jgi:hypothetical protein